MLRGIPDFLRVFTLPTCAGNIKGLTWFLHCSLWLLIVIIIIKPFGKAEAICEVLCFICLDRVITTLSFIIIFVVEGSVMLAVLTLDPEYGVDVFSK